MCRIGAEFDAHRLGYASAALHLWESGQRKPAAWLLRRQGIALEEWRDRGAKDIFIYCLRPIYDYADKLDAAEARRRVPRETCHTEPEQ